MCIPLMLLLLCHILSIFYILYSIFYILSIGICSKDLGQESSLLPRGEEKKGEKPHLAMVYLFIPILINIGAHHVCGYPKL